ncbi:hypothetical protein SDRG_04335 [Saprolegnia diclina VS20]|uniref:Serine aminopeptidase S33 domain-containing protein n=1 Tax=Saprolegnia diclina (strain VS20) TaxID=1156394 RepID=T0QX60_SAPDV|nr:hypothetical protein SDRG_04335 [Saprolegnia diclina VS20]EQC38635.1 hypothetical protein SDRG_04335 [Saprolegnia diclina VS20]|eukprot:XP_008608227.1 hypothetical protein SDRG_04335 [Saprolegnia diclina VS20]
MMGVSTWLRSPTVLAAISVGAIGAGLYYLANDEADIAARMRTPLTPSEVELRALATHAREHVAMRDASLFVQSWVPSDCKAIVLLVHGMNEHSGYLERLTDALLRASYGVYAFDHEGFGRSSGTHALVTDYAALVRDVQAHIALARAAWPEKKIFLAGCSFGAALIVHTLLDSADGIDGVILQAPALQLAANRRPPPLVEALVSVLATVAPRLPIVPSNGGKGSSPLVRDAVVAKKRADPLYYSGKVRLGTAYSVLQTMDGLQTPAATAAFASLTVPLLLQHGTADVVCALDGSETWFHSLLRCDDKQLITYPDACHDLLHEPAPIANAVVTDLVAWLDARTLGA